MSLGATGEAFARAYLESGGLKFRAANVRAPFGEIDLVMEDHATGELVFVEVKARQESPYGLPEEAVTAQKRRKLSQLVAWYCQHAGWQGPVRLDVVGVLFRPDRAPEVTHTRWVG